MFAATKLLTPLCSFLLSVVTAYAKEANAMVAAGDGPGIRAIRSLEEEERDIIQRAYNSHRPQQQFKNNYCIDMFHRGGTANGITITSMTGEEVEDTCGANVTAHDKKELEQLVHKIAGDRIVQDYGFIVAPANSTLYQHFHNDYSNTLSTYWIPLVDLTSRNAPQFIPNFVGYPTEGEKMFGSEFTLMENEGLLGMVVAQTICRAFTLVYMAPRTIHRGIPNGEKYDRPMFVIEMDDEPYDSDNDFSENTSTEA
jgi:hypothetical protein